MTIVVDASVAIKWVLDEEDSVAARGLIETDLLAAPDLFFVECANVLWRKTRRGLVSQDEALTAMRAIESTPIRSIAGRPHVAMAQRISQELEQTVYNSLYLAIAMAERMIFVTADAAFSRAAMANPAYRDWLRPLRA